jgi:Arc-like DNA binding domain
MARRTTETVHLKLRFREALRRRIEQAARRNEQSMNAEIIDRLERSFAKDDTRSLLEETITAIRLQTGETIEAIRVQTGETLAAIRADKAEIKRRWPEARKRKPTKEG